MSDVTKRVGLAVLIAALAAAGVSAATAATRGKSVKEVTAKLKNAQGKTVGTATFEQDRGSAVEVEISARGLTRGFHGFHIHATGVCEAPSKSPDGMTGPFLSAGGHLSRTGQAHGGHAGDMPPLLVSKNGRAKAEFTLDSFKASELVAGDGSAVMIHAGPDNSANIPSRYKSDAAPQGGPDAETLKTGDSGARAACGVAKVKR